MKDRTRRQAAKKSAEPAAPPETSPTSGRRDVVRQGFVAFTFAMGAVLGWRKIFSPDTGFHLSSARWIVEHRAFPRTDVLTYTVPDHAYVDLQWLYQLGLYGVNALAGSAGIIASGIALTLLFWALMLLRLQRRDGAWPLSSCVLLLLFSLGTYWENRPHLLSWIYGSMLLLILELPPASRRRWLPALPLILLLWVNSHSLFVLGLVILAVFVADEWRKGRAGDAKLWPWALASAGICLVNPYGWHGVTFPLQQFAELQAGSPFKSAEYGIHEFLSPFDPRAPLQEGRFVPFRPALFQCAFAGLAAVAAIAGWRRIRAREWALLAMFFYLFATAGKNFPYFVMACFPVVASGVGAAGASVAQLVTRRLRAPHRDEATQRFARGATAAAMLVLFVPAATGALGDAAWAPHPRGIGFDPLSLPVGSCRFLAEHHVEGRVLNALGQGGYIHWITRQPVFVHGITEILGASFYLEYLATEEPKGFDAALRRWQPEVAIVSVDHTPYWLFALAHRRDWRIVYRDREETVFLHESLRPDIPALPPPRAGADFPAYDDGTAERILREAMTKRAASLYEKWRGVAAYPRDELRASGSYLQTGETDAAIGTALAGLQRTPYMVPDLLLTLGHAYNKRGDYPRADLCFDAFLRARANSPLAQDVRRVRAERRKAASPK